MSIQTICLYFYPENTCEVLSGCLSGLQLSFLLGCALTHQKRLDIKSIFFDFWDENPFTKGVK